ncbi:hypothetical protein AMTR_s00014p00169490 [Amborella trichopoda]|uniref:Uncharacterized protein n=1 Tax=Amborella trichopoda TaxID=13333 RepID=W1PGJ9_AMBTC|nr:hypothetical protein AMTR_s00014p00169490 [Amborella trichopoda]
MEAQKMTNWEAKKQEFVLRNVDTFSILPHAAVKKNVFDWELEVNWQNLHVKIPFGPATPEHLPRDLMLASSAGTSPIMLIESSSSEGDLSPGSRNLSKKLYKMMKVLSKTTMIFKAVQVEYTGEIVVVEEGIVIGDLNWNPTWRRRAKKNEAQRLVMELPSTHFLLFSQGSLGVGKNFIPD